MGNIIRGGRERKINPISVLLTVRATGAFKTKAIEAKRRRESTTDQAENTSKSTNVLEDSKKVMKPCKLASIDETREQTVTNDFETEIMKFVHSVNIRDNNYVLAVNDTDVAWTALRVSTNVDSRKAAVQQRQMSNAGHRFRRLFNAVRFMRKIRGEDTTTILPTTKTRGKISLSYNQYFVPTWETQCHICGSSNTCSTLNRCRICERVYHTDCLERRGYLSQGLSCQTLELSTTDIGWSCYYCEDLSSLLSDTENIELVEAFDNIDKNQDSFISKEEYLAYQRECYRKEKGMEMPGYRMEIEERTVADMDRKGTGIIDWWNFLIPMCARKLAENKDIPLTWLTKQELYKLREIFKRYDQDGRGEIGRQASRKVFKTWYLSLIDLPPEQVPIWEWLGCKWFGDQREFPLEKWYNTVEWEEFVQDYASCILVARPNTGSLKPYIPAVDP